MERLAHYCIWHATPQHAVMCGFVESATPGTTAASRVRRDGSSLSPSFCRSIFCHHTTYLILHQAMRIVTICMTLHERYTPFLLCYVFLSLESALSFHMHFTIVHFTHHMDARKRCWGSGKYYHGPWY